MTFKFYSTDRDKKTSEENDSVSIFIVLFKECFLNGVSIIMSRSMFYKSNGQESKLLEYPFVLIMVNKITQLKNCHRMKIFQFQIVQSRMNQMASNACIILIRIQGCQWQVKKLHFLIC